MATSKTVSSVSNSNKQDSNKESVSYLVFFSNDDGNLDESSYLICPTKENIFIQAQNDWDIDLEDLDKLRILPFKTSQFLRIKQTIELV